jgi:hypothetical protein
MVPLYVPLNTPLGTVTTIVGFQLTEWVVVAAVAENAVRVAESVWAVTAVACPAVATTVPDVAVANPDQYLMALVAIVPRDPPEPVVKLVAETVASHEHGLKAEQLRVSSTVTVPSDAENVVPPVPDRVPRSALEGTLMASVLARMLNVSAGVVATAVGSDESPAVVVVVRLIVVVVVVDVVVLVEVDVVVVLVLEDVVEVSSAGAAVVDVVDVVDVVVVDCPFACAAVAVNASTRAAETRTRRNTLPLSVIGVDLARISDGLPFGLVRTWDGEMIGQGYEGQRPAYRSSSCNTAPHTPHTPTSHQEPQIP